MHPTSLCEGMPHNSLLTLAFSIASFCLSGPQNLGQFCRSYRNRESRARWSSQYSQAVTGCVADVSIALRTSADCRQAVVCEWGLCLVRTATIFVERDSRGRVVRHWNEKCAVQYSSEEQYVLHNTYTLRCTFARRLIVSSTVIGLLGSSSTVIGFFYSQENPCQYIQCQYTSKRASQFWFYFSILLSTRLRYLVTCQTQQHENTEFYLLPNRGRFKLR